MKTTKKLRRLRLVRELPTRDPNLVRTPVGPVFRQPVSDSGILAVVFGSGFFGSGFPAAAVSARSFRSFFRSSDSSMILRFSGGRDGDSLGLLGAALLILSPDAPVLV